MLHEAAEMYEGGAGRSAHGFVREQRARMTPGTRGQAERLPLDELRMLASCVSN